jgi:uncharacterized Zn finger protein (UPF0148 family)
VSETITVKNAPWSDGDKLVALLGAGPQVCPTCKTALIRNDENLLRITVYCPTCMVGTCTGGSPRPTF